MSLKHGCFEIRCWSSNDMVCARNLAMHDAWVSLVHTPFRLHDTRGCENGCPCCCECAGDAGCSMPSVEWADKALTEGAGVLVCPGSFREPLEKSIEKPVTKENEADTANCDQLEAPPCNWTTAHDDDALGVGWCPTWRVQYC